MSRRTTQLKRLRGQQARFHLVVPTSTVRATGVKSQWFRDDSGNLRRGNRYPTNAVGTLPMHEAKHARLAALWAKWGGDA